MYVFIPPFWKEESYSTNTWNLLRSCYLEHKRVWFGPITSKSNKQISPKAIFETKICNDRSFQNTFPGIHTHMFK